MRAVLLAKLDLNKDGQISLTEHRAGKLSYFDQIDTDKKGVVTVAEMKVARVILIKLRAHWNGAPLIDASRYSAATSPMPHALGDAAATQPSVGPAIDPEGSEAAAGWSFH